MNGNEIRKDEKRDVEDEKRDSEDENMFYVEMQPKQIREAVMRNVPIVMSAGAVEYHGPHLPIGTDWLIAETILRRVEQH